MTLGDEDGAILGVTLGAVVVGAMVGLAVGFEVTGAALGLSLENADGCVLKLRVGGFDAC